MQMAPEWTMVRSSEGEARQEEAPAARSQVVAVWSGYVRCYIRVLHAWHTKQS